MAVETAFDHRELLDEFRTRSTEWVAAHRDEMVRVQRRARVRELAATAVLDERRALDDTLAAHDGVSLRTVQETVETARALAALPAVAAAAHAGVLSDEQLTAVTRLADPGTDAEWAARAPRCTPADLVRLARAKTKPTVDDARQRREARALTLVVAGRRGDARRPR